MHRTLLLIPVLLAAGLLAACGSETDDDGRPPPPTTQLAEPGADTSDLGASTVPGAPTPSERRIADGELILRVDGGRVFLSASTADPSLVLRDLSLALTTPTGSSWDVLVTRPIGPRSERSDLPDTYDGVVTRPGAPVDVGVFELGPRPPEEITLCVEVVPLTAEESDAETGATVLLPPGGDGDEPAYLCATTPVT